MTPGRHEFTAPYTLLIILLCMKKYLQETNAMNENNVSDKYRKRLFDVW